MFQFCPELVYIPSALAGWEFTPGHQLQEGWAHGSLEVAGSIETRSMDNRTKDDNAVRQAGFFGLHEWLQGRTRSGCGSRRRKTPTTVMIMVTICTVLVGRLTCSRKPSAFHLRLGRIRQG